jgi:hypothetical protein
MPGLVLAVVLLTLAYLHTVGFPGFVRQFVRKEFARRGVAVQFVNLRLDVLRGVVATGAVLADAKVPDRPLAEIDEVQLLWNWRRMLRRENAVDAIRIANAKVSIPTPADEIGPEVFTAHNAYATIRFEDDGTIRLDQLTGLYAGIRVNLSGRLLPRAAAPVLQPVPTPPGAETKPLSVVTKVVRELNRLQGLERVELEVDFDVDLAQPWEGRATASLRGTELSYRGLHIDGADVRVSLNRGALQIEPLQVKLYGGEVVVRGRYDFGLSQFDLTLDSTTDLSRLRVLLPAAAARELATLQFADKPHLAARYTLSAETGALPRLTGTVAIGRASFRDVQFRQIKFAVAGQWPVLKVSDAVIVTPEGRLTGHGQIHAESTDFEYEFESTLDPVKLLPIMTPGMARIVEPAWFGVSPHLVAKVRGDFVDPQVFAYDAVVAAGECSYRGVRLTGAAAKLQLRTSRLDVQDVVLKRPEGELQGTIFANFDTHRVRFDVQTTANPTEMAPLLGPKAGQVMQSYRFGSNTVANAKGIVDFDQLARTTWTAHVVNDGFSYWKLTASHAQADLVFTNSILTVRDLDADFYDGVMIGWAEFDFRQPDARYQVGLSPTRADINKLFLSAGARTKMTGYLTGELRLDGRGSDLANLTGDGWLEVNDGILWEGPLFGIFSKILGKTKATSAKASYTVANKAVSTDKMEIEAGLFNAKTRGAIGFDGSLDFYVEARFLSAIPGWNIISVILGKVLEYKVGGTLGEPSYRPVNLPKELLPHGN